MGKYGVLLHVRNVFMQDEGAPAQLAGVYVNCCVDAPDAETAGNLTLDILQRHPKYLRLESWPGEPNGRPSVEADSVDRLDWWRRPYKRGISTGFIFYVDTDREDNAETRMAQEQRAVREDEP